MRVLVLGATGFIGFHLVEELLDQGHEVVGVARDPRGFDRFRGRITAVPGGITRPETYRSHLRGCGGSINLVGLLRERRAKGLTYEKVVVEGTRDWVAACDRANVGRIAYVSALGAAPQGTPYLRTKWAAEQAVRGSSAQWTIFRPSFVSGEDGAMPQFASLLRLRFVPVWGRQTYQFEPVDVEDLAKGLVAALKNPKARSRVYSVGGPDRLTYKEMLKAIGRATKTRALFLPAPWWAGFTMAALLGWLPFFPATVENLRQLKQGSIASDAQWAADLGVERTPFEESLAKHLTPGP
jgi:uncharacterized protein YbjT (DUF2867 family)